MERVNRYDSNLQMFVQDGRDPDIQHLRFLRWLAERGWLEHAVAGAPAGEYKIAAAESSVIELPLSSAFARLADSRTRVNANLGNRFGDAVQFGNHTEGSQSIRFR